MLRSYHIREIMTSRETHAIAEIVHVYGDAIKMVHAEINHINIVVAQGTKIEVEKNVITLTHFEED